MSSGAASFLIFSSVNFCWLCLGYAARRRRWVNEELSRPIHFHTVVWIWSSAILLSLWKLPIRVENLWLLVIQPVLMGLCAYGSIPLAKAIGCTRDQVGVIAVASGLGNHGFTLGSYLCYVLLDPPDEALAYSTAYAMVTNLSVVTLIYPLARYYGANSGAHDGGGSSRSPGGSRTGGPKPIAVMMAENFLDLRAMPMYAALVGVGLAATDTAFPLWISRWHVLEVLFYLGGLGGYLGIGLRLRLGDSKRYLKHHVLVAGMKLMVMPLAAAALLWGISLTPRPVLPLMRQVVEIQAMTPCAIITVMIANLFHLDPRLASVVWVWNTVLFVGLSLPVVLMTMA